MANSNTRIIYTALILIFIGSLAAKTARAQSGSEPELPRTLLNTTYVPPAGNMINVAAGGNLQAALNAANPGDTIVLQAGATFVGNFILPNKPGSGWIIIRSSAPDTSLPSPGTRLQPSYSGAMPKIVTANVSAAISTAAGAHHFRFIGVEFGIAQGVTTNYGIVVFGDSATSDITQVPHDLILDRCYIHGNDTGDCSRGVTFNAAAVALIDSTLSNIHGLGFDTQAVCGWNGPGPFKLTNNYLEAAGENVLFGGADPKIANLVQSDIEIQFNTIRKPLSWKTTDPTYAGVHWTVKNLLELKNAQRVLINGNDFENCWVDAQAGYAILFTPRNQGGTAPWSVVQDVTFTNNLIRNSEAGFDILGSDDEHPSQRENRIKIANNVLDQINSLAFALLSGIQNLTISHNTILEGSSIVTADGSPATTGFVFVNNIAAPGTYGIFGSGVGEGNTCLSTYFPGAVVLKNALSGRDATLYPTGNYFPTDLNSIGFTDLPNANYRLAASSPYKGAGTDGKDLGADIDALTAALANSTPPSQSLTVNITASVTTGVAPLAVSFTCTTAAPAGQVIAYNWDFGDGQTATAPAVSHTYQTAGVCTARLTVTDNLGATASASVFINVSAPQATPPLAANDIVLYASQAPVVVGNYQVVSDPTAAGGARMWNPDAGAAKLVDPLANPATYFEISFNAQAGVPYHLWIRGKADANSPYNDSVFVQFSGSVNSSGSAIDRIGTTSAEVINLEDYLDIGLSGWGWQDNGWGVGVLGPNLYFQTSGTQTLRIQPREDGLSIDQIILSPRTYLNSSPGSLKNDTTIFPKSGGTQPAPAMASITPSSGMTAGGTSVTITGSNFVSGATVSFGGTLAPNVNVGSFTSIMATTPAHAVGVVPVMVTNPDGQCFTVANGFTYNAPPPAPTITAVSPNSGAPTGGTSVTITGTGFAAGATVSFGGTAATNVNIASATSLTATTPAHAAGAVNVVVTYSDGQSATLTNAFTYNVPAPTLGDIVLYAAQAKTKMGKYSVVSDATAAGGARMWNPDAGAAMLSQPLAKPKTYFEITFTAQAGVPYRLWLRGKADNNSPNNDSVFVQFSGSVDASNNVTYRIGTANATVVNLEDYTGAGLSGWGWQDNGFGAGVLGPLIYFQTTGTQTLRIQPREDGLSIDQIVLSPANYLFVSPGTLQNDVQILPQINGASRVVKRKR